MYKVLGIILFAFLLFHFACDKAPETNLPMHQFITIPAESRLMSIECGQPCAIVASPETNAYIALLLNGDTITFQIEEE